MCVWFWVCVYTRRNTITSNFIFYGSHVLNIILIFFTISTNFTTTIRLVFETYIFRFFNLCVLLSCISSNDEGIVRHTIVICATISSISVPVTPVSSISSMISSNVNFAPICVSWTPRIRTRTILPVLAGRVKLSFHEVRTTHNLSITAHSL